MPTKKEKAELAKRQRLKIERKHAAGLYELRACWLPRALHARVKEHARNLIRSLSDNSGEHE